MIDFPASPTLNQLFTASNGAVYSWNGTVWVPVGVGGSAIALADTPPSNPVIGQLWWNSTLGSLFIWYDDGTSQQWVPATPVPTLAGVFTLYSEALAAAPASQLAVSFPSAAKLVELVWDVIVTPTSDPSIFLQGMSGGSPVTSSSYTLTRFVAQAPSGATSNGGDVNTSTAWNIVGGFSFRGKMTFTTPAKGLGVGSYGAITSAGVRTSGYCFVESVLTTLDGFRLGLASNNFATGSFLRCMVLA